MRLSAHFYRPYILTGCYDGKSRIWDLSGNTVGLLSGHSKPIKSVSWLSTEKDTEMICLTGGMDQKVLAHSFKPESKSVSTLYECVGHMGSVESIAPMENVHQVRWFLLHKRGSMSLTYTLKVCHCIF
jgi:ribosome biogenesis protein YTM1